MGEQVLGEFLLRKVHISSSQEQLLSSISGWEESVARVIDDTPSQPESSGFDKHVVSSSEDEDYGLELSQKPVEWASPDPTPVSARATLSKTDDYKNAYDSDRIQSPRRRLSWGFTHQVNSNVSEDEQRGTKLDGEGLKPKDEKGGSENIDLSETVDDEKKGVTEEDNVVPSATPEVRNEQTSPLIGQALPNQDIFLPEERSVPSSAHEDTIQSDEVAGKIVPVVMPLTACASPGSEDSLAGDPPGPPMTVLQKLRRIRRLGAERSLANKKKRERAESYTFYPPESVVDVVKRMSSSEQKPVVSAADLLSAALASGVTLPHPFSRNYFKRC